MSDFYNIVFSQQVCDELLDMKLSDFFAMVDKRGLDEIYQKMSDLFGDVAEIIIEERSQ